jgi:hypothetical protein
VFIVLGPQLTRTMYTLCRSIGLGYQGHSLHLVNDPNNLVGACQQCNISKINIYLNQWNGKNRAAGQWFPHGAGPDPQANAVIPRRRGAPISQPANW